MIAVLIPVLNRPHRVKPLVESLAACSEVIRCRPVFLLSPGDDKELAAVDRAGADKIVMPYAHTSGDYARKINTGVAATDEPFVFLGGDDLWFQPGWAERAIAAWYETGCCVVGTNDLGNTRVVEGRHSTHSLVHRDYLECGTADEPGVLLHEGYWHNYVDDEFVQTAMWRDTFVHANDSIVEHLHPNFGKARHDDTYRLGGEHFRDDELYHRQRRHLWGK